MNLTHEFSYNYADGNHAENPVTQEEFYSLWEDNIIVWHKKIWPFPDDITEEEEAKQWMMDFINNEIYVPGSICQRTYDSSNELLALNFWVQFDPALNPNMPGDMWNPVYNVDPTFMLDTAEHKSGWFKKVDGSISWIYDSDGKLVYGEPVTPEVLSKINCTRWCGASGGSKSQKAFTYGNSTNRLYTDRIDDDNSPLYRLSEFGWPDNNWSRGGS